MKEINIETIRTLGLINPNLLNIWADACSILLNLNKHNSPIKFAITGQIEQTTNLKWETITNHAGYEDLEETAGSAGYGAAILILFEFQNLIPVSRRAKGDGIDIVCSKTVKDDDNFLNTSEGDYHVECKGSRMQKYVRRYLNNGIRQSKNAPGNVFVISTEFETPSIITHFRK